HWSVRGVLSNQHRHHTLLPLGRSRKRKEAPEQCDGELGEQRLREPRANRNATHGEPALWCAHRRGPSRTNIRHPHPPRLMRKKTGGGPASASAALVLNLGYCVTARSALIRPWL